jgi:hypothetical protein
MYKYASPYFCNMFKAKEFTFAIVAVATMLLLGGVGIEYAQGAANGGNSGSTGGNFGHDISAISHGGDTGGNTGGNTAKGQIIITGNEIAIFLRTQHANIIKNNNLS